MRLADWLEREGRSATWLAEQVGRDRSFISKVMKDEARPSVEIAARIQVLTGGEVTAIDYVETAASERAA